MFKKVQFIIFLLFIIILSSCSDDEIIYKKKYNTYTVSSGILNIDNNFVGYTKGQIETTLSTKSAGRITYLKKNIGDSVLIGEKLVSLDSEEAKVGYSTAGNLVSMLYGLKQSTKQTYDDQIKAMEFRISQSLKNFKGSQTGIEDTKNISQSQLDSQNANINKANIALETAQTNLKENIKILKISKDHIIKNSKNSITSSIILYNNIINYIDSILGITELNKNKNNNYEDYLSAKNNSYLTLARDNFINSNNLLIEYKKIYEENIENSDDVLLNDMEIISILEKGEKLGENIKILLKNMWDVMDNSISSLGALSEDDIIIYKNEISNFGNKVEESILVASGNYLLGLKGSLQSLENLDHTNNKTIILLEKEVLLAKATLESAQKAYNLSEAESLGKINETETKNEIAKNLLDELYASLNALKSTKDSKIKEINNKIIEAEGNKQNAGVMINNGEIFSPINGIITEKNFENGQVIGAGIPIYTVSDNSKIKIILFVPDYILKTLDIGNDLNVNIEGVDKEFNGIIVNIANSKNEVTKKTQIDIIIDNYNSDIKVGSMAYINFKNITNDIIIPNNSIISKFLIPSVYILEGDTAILKKIKILSQSNDYSGISGLKIGDVIITDGKENIYDGEKLN